MSWPWPRLVIRSNGFTIQWQPQRLTQEDQILDMEDQSEANTAVTTGSEDTMNNNMSVTMTSTVNIGDEVLTITGYTEDLVKTASDVVNKYFNVVREESKIEEAGAEEAEAVEAALLEDVVSGEDAMAGEMETESSGQATENEVKRAEEAPRTGCARARSFFFLFQNIALNISS